MHEPEPPGSAQPPGTARRRRTWLRRGALVCAILVALFLAPAGWLLVSSAGHTYQVEDAPDAPVAIVFGAQLAAGGEQPKPFLRGRLDIAAQLLRRGAVKAILVSGDAAGSSGDETAVMTRYLVGRGVPKQRIAADDHGLDSYDTCRRAHDVYGVRKALLVSQAFHLPRAVTLCRSMGIDADGVAALCDGCQWHTMACNRGRELAAGWKAAFDWLRDRPPAVTSPPDPSLRRITGR